jgi:protein-disulfide isomerase
LRKLLADTNARIRLVHRHYPLDNACHPYVKEQFHPRACEYSLLAHCAGEQGRFWEANDYLFANGRRRSPIHTKELARAVALDETALAACVASDEAMSIVQADIQAGVKHGIRGTPTFVVNGRTYVGHVPAKVLRDAIPAPADAGPTRSAEREPD